MRLRYNKQDCIGCQNCVSICPKYFKPTDDGRVELLDKNSDDSSELKEAIDSCPVKCIKEVD